MKGNLSWTFKPQTCLQRTTKLTFIATALPKIEIAVEAAKSLTDSVFYKLIFIRKIDFTQQQKKHHFETHLSL